MPKKWTITDGNLVLLLEVFDDMFYIFLCPDIDTRIIYNKDQLDWLFNMFE